MDDLARPPPNAPPPFGRRFWPLLGVGALGVVTLPLMIPAVVEAKLRVAAPGISLATLKLLTLVQPALLLAAGAALGAALAYRLGLSSHLAEVNVRRRFVSELPLAASSGLVTGVLVVVVDRWVFRTGPLPSAAPDVRNIFEGLLGGVLYGGLTEEVMMRWGLMSLVAWVGLRLVGGSDRRSSAQRASRGPGDAPGGVPAIAAQGGVPAIAAQGGVPAIAGPGGVPTIAGRALVFPVAIVIVSLLFAAGHLPAAAMIAPLAADVVARILLLNGIAGLVFGWLFWKRSLESAMVAHASVHVVFAVARLLRWS